jgi:thiosulfate dehydrogenase
MNDRNKADQKLIKIIHQLLNLITVLMLLLIVLPLLIFYSDDLALLFKPAPTKELQVTQQNQISTKANSVYWKAPDINSITDTIKSKQVAYGKELIMHTSNYLGPFGSVANISNGMNCQNCHLEAGTKIFGNNYGSVASLYPKFRARSGSIENIYKRINDCFERSLNGKPLDTLSNEMQSMKAYIEFVGSNVEKGKKAEGSGFKDLDFLTRACDLNKGKLAYESKCISCHQANGEGVLQVDKKEYQYPPLWGIHSFNDGAGLYRISNFAKYIKYNMPLGASHESSLLTDEETWDIAAFVNSQSRPHKNTPNDWPDISKKPIDHPFGPYKDNFSEKQHKYGPFKPIQNAHKKIEQEKSKTTAALK